MKYKTGDYIIMSYVPHDLGSAVAVVEDTECDGERIIVKDADGQSWYVYAKHLRPATDTEILHHKLLGF